MEKQVTTMEVTAESETTSECIAFRLLGDLDLALAGGGIGDTVL